MIRVIVRGDRERLQAYLNQSWRDKDCIPEVGEGQDLFLTITIEDKPYFKQEAEAMGLRCLFLDDEIKSNIS